MAAGSDELSTSWVDWTGVRVRKGPGQRARNARVPHQLMAGPAGPALGVLYSSRKSSVHDLSRSTLSSRPRAPGTTHTFRRGDLVARNAKLLEMGAWCDFKVINLAVEYHS